MVQASLRSGAADRRAVFEVFARHLPHGRRYGVVAGTGRLLDAIERFRFDPADLEFLGGAGIVDYATCAADGDISTCDALASYTMMGQFITQLKAVSVSFIWSAVASSIVFFIIKFTVGLKASAEAEEEGLDIVEHGERAYHS